MFDGSKVKIDDNKKKIKKSQELKFGVAASALRLLLAPDKRLSNNQKGYSPKRPLGG